MSDLTNQQTLDALTNQLSDISQNMATKKDLTELETRLTNKMDRIEQKVDAVGDTLAGVVDNMATTQDIARLDDKLTNKIDSVELRLGRRIDNAFQPKPAH